MANFYRLLGENPKRYFTRKTPSAARNAKKGFGLLIGRTLVQRPIRMPLFALHPKRFRLDNFLLMGIEKIYYAYPNKTHFRPKGETIMALDPQYYQEAKEAAPLHLRVTDLILKQAPPRMQQHTSDGWRDIPTTEADYKPIPQPPLPIGTHLRILVSGKVEQVFRGGELARVGDRIEFTVEAYSKAFPIGGQGMDYDQLINAQSLDAYLEAEPPRFTPVLGLVTIVKTR
jgi:hypothetical protein